MVSLYVSEIGSLILRFGAGDELFDALAQRRYLTRRAKAHRNDVIALMAAAAERFPNPAPAGAESWRDIEAALRGAGYLNLKARIWGSRFVNRDGTGLSPQPAADEDVLYRSEIDLTAPIVTIVFDGVYPDGSAGNEIAAQMAAYVSDEIESTHAEAVVFDMTNLRYRSGDAIASLALPLVIERDRFRPAAIVARGATAAALRGLLRPDYLFGIAGVELFSSGEEAIRHVTARLATRALPVARE